MNLDMAKSLIKKSVGEGIYSVYIPSLKKDVPFKHMNVGQRKTLSKVAIEYSTNTDLLKYQFVKLAVASELCLDPSIDVSTLTDIDFIAMMSAIRRNNIMTPLTITLVCDKCQKKFSFAIDFNAIEEKAKAYTPITQVIEKVVAEGLKFKVVLSEPSIIMNLSHKQFIESLSQKKEENEVRDVRVLNYPIQFVNEIWINDEIVEEYKTLDYVERMKFLEEFVPPAMMFDEESDSILTKVLDMFPISREDALFYTVVCPFCKDAKEDAVAFDSFFII